MRNLSHIIFDVVGRERQDDLRQLAPVRARLVYVLRVRDVARLTDGGRGVRVSCLGRMPLPILLSSPRFLCILGSVAAKSAVNFVK